MYSTPSIRLEVWLECRPTGGVVDAGSVHEEIGCAGDRSLAPGFVSHRQDRLLLRGVSKAGVHLRVAETNDRAQSGALGEHLQQSRRLGGLQRRLVLLHIGGAALEPLVLCREQLVVCREESRRAGAAGKER